MSVYTDFRDAHRGAPMLVCGLGESLALVRSKPGCVTIGVNDIGRVFDPTYLLCMDPLDVFPPDRRVHVEQSRARHLFTDADTGIMAPRVILCRLSFSSRARAADDGGLYHRGAPLTSTYLALGLAAYLGADPIGLIGIDLRGGYVFDRGHDHNLTSCAPALDRMFGDLAGAIAADGTRVVNLSDRSALTSIPSMRIKDFPC